MKKLLLKNLEIISAADTDKYYVGIVHDKIVIIDKYLPPGYEDAEIIDCAGKIAVPGLVNTHTHAAMTLLRSYADDMVLMDWLENKIWPAEAGLNDDDIYWGTMLAIVEMLKSGTTCFADMYFAMDRVAEAVQETGIRASLARGLVGLTPDADTKIDENIELYKNWHNKADGRIKVMLGPHAPYTCPIEYLKKVIKVAEHDNIEIHMHLSETKGEVEDCIKEHGMSPIKLMNSLGMFDCGTLAAHAVHLNNEDIMIMSEKKVRVAHNPQSNLKLASGVAPVPKLLDHGIIVGLGTDGASSNNNLDMLEECRLAALLHKGISGDPMVIPAVTALDMATRQGYRALGFKDVGAIKVGEKADIVLYDMNAAHWYPRNDRTSLFVYSANAGDADTVIVAGKILMKNKILLGIDVERVYKEANTRAHRLIKK